jgi:hypothetical protein
MIAEIYLILLTNPLLAAGLTQALGGAVGIIQGISLVGTFGGLAGAAIAALTERHLAGVKLSLVVAGISALAWIICQTFFSAGGFTSNITPQGIN